MFMSVLFSAVSLHVSQGEHEESRDIYITIYPNSKKRKTGPTIDGVLGNL